MKTLSIYKTQTQIEKQTRETDSRHRPQTREQEADKDHPLHKPLSSTIPARAKVDLVPIECGQWILAYVEHFMPDPDDLGASVERLTSRGSGWICLHQPSDQFEVRQVARVMPKTYVCTRESYLHPGTITADRFHRAFVVAAADTAGEMLVLRDKLFTIGFAADRAIEEETARVMSDFAKKTRADALAKVHAALPHIFGRDA